MNYVETYSKSGFFGIQDDFKINELLLMLDYGIFSSLFLWINSMELTLRKY